MLTEFWVGTLESQFCVNVTISLLALALVITANQLYIEVALLLNPISVPLTPSHSSPCPVSLLSHNQLSLQLMQPSQAGRPGLLQWAKPEEECQGSLFFRMLLRVADIPCRRVYHLNKQDHAERSAEKNHRVIRISARFKACTISSVNFLWSLLELGGGEVD